MMTLTDIREQLELLDVKLIALMDERRRLCEGHYFDKDEKAEVISYWLEDAGDRGMDEAKIEKIAKLLMMMGQRDED